MPDEPDVELPHGAWYNHESGVVSLPVDRVILLMSLEEFSEFADSIDDIHTVISQMIVRQHSECPTCGTEFDTIDVTPPDDESIN
jgi:hypothetical protein